MIQRIAVIPLILSCIFMSSCQEEMGKTYTDNGEIIFQGNFPYDQNAETRARTDTLLVPVKLKTGKTGTIETRDHNLALAFCSPNNKCKIIWRYTDYYSVKKITFDRTEDLLRIYYDGALLREMGYVNEFRIDSFDLEKRLLRKGKWRL
jgi:hypothetical protein